MAERVRITNESVHDCGVKLQNGIEYNIRPGAFITLTKEDVEYLVSIAHEEFNTGELRIGDKETAEDLNVLKPGDAAPISEDEIRKALNGRVSAIRDYLEGIDNDYVKQAIIHVAHEMDLPTSKMKLLKEFFPKQFSDGE